MPRVTASQKKELNALLHKICRARDGEGCLRCGKQTYLQLSHIRSVGAWKKLQFDPDNVKLLCRACHIFWWHKEPLEANDWIRELKPKEMKRLDLIIQAGTKIPFDYKLTKLLLEQELKKYESNA